MACGGVGDIIVMSNSMRHKLMRPGRVRAARRHFCVGSKLDTYEYRHGEYLAVYKYNSACRPPAPLKADENN